MKLSPYVKDLMSKHLMTLSEASRITGNQPSWAINHMIKALQLHTWNNTIEDERRLVAAIIYKRTFNKR